MKKIYATPIIRITQVTFTTALLDISNVTGDNNIGGGGDDSGGEHDPDAKHRGGIDGYGNLW